MDLLTALALAVKHLPGQHNQDTHAGKGRGKWEKGVPRHYAEQAADKAAEAIGDEINENVRAKRDEGGKYVLSVFAPAQPEIAKVTSWVNRHGQSYGYQHASIKHAARKNYLDVTLDSG